MKKKLSILLCTLMVVVMCIFTAGCSDLDDGDYAELGELTLVKGDKAPSINPKKLSLNEVVPHDKKQFTLMVYMVGTDLESEGGCATEDLREMAGAQVDASKVNIVVLTGGTEKWNNKVINSKKTMIYSMDKGAMTEEATFGKAAVSDPATMTAFINYAMTAFPADRYGIVMWNHGGGPIHGYGVDQLNDENSLGIKDIQKAFANSMLANQPAEFIGFDACLMATVETATLLQNYGKYLIASEEAEPGFGWNWNWLTALNENPAADGKDLGKVIADKFIDVCNSYDMEGTLSVIDLSKVQQLAASVDALSQVTNDTIAHSKKQVRHYAKERGRSKSFGNMGDDESFDVVDIGSYAQQLKKDYPQQADNVQNALKQAVVYNKISDNMYDATGITLYSPYYCVEMADYSADVFASLGIMGNHNKLVRTLAKRLGSVPVDRAAMSDCATKATPQKDGYTVTIPQAEVENVDTARFVLWRQLEKNSDYFVRLAVIDGIEVKDNGEITTKFDGYWVTYGGQPFALRERDRNEEKGVITYTAPAYLNDRKVSLVIRQDKENKYGKIMYAVPVEVFGKSHAASKEMIKLKEGDKLVPRYWANLFLKNPADLAKYNNETHKWVKGQEVTVGSDTKLKLDPVGDELYLFNFWITDVDGHNYYTKGIEVRY